jgi:hypothetical protein
VAILQPFDARPQQSDCHTQEMDKTKHFVEITSGVVGKFRATSSLNNGHRKKPANELEKISYLCVVVSPPL